MSKKSFNKLNKAQQAALLAAGQKAEDFFVKAGKELDQKMVDAFKKAGVKVVEMSDAQAQAWRDIANKTSYVKFAEKVKGGEALIQKALAVE